MHILISPNAFKDSLKADEVAQAIKKGFLKSNLVCTCECFPIGDGGDGTASLLIERCNGTFVNTRVRDALGRKINTTYGLIDDGKTAVIEMANATGIRLLQQEELKPLSATSFGTGEQIKLALGKGVNKIIIGMGGSATVDGGVGILKALGVRFLDEEGDELLILPEDLVNLTSIDVSGLDERVLNCEVVVLCDVENPLLGKQGAAAVFGPQKGASSDDIEKLNKSLLKLSKIILKATGKDISQLKHGGSAGGAAAGLYALLNAQLVNGIDYFLDFTSFNASLENADLLITGEGSIDEQTLQGKGPFGVAYRAKLKSLPVIAFAGNVPLTETSKLNPYFDALIPITHRPISLREALPSTEANIIRTARMTGNLLALRSKLKT
jgi:glycerate kinase